MSTDTPRPERVTLTDEEMGALYDARIHSYWQNTPPDGQRAVYIEQDIHAAVERILAAREQALRDQIAGQIEELAVLTGDEESRLYDAYRFGDDGVAHRDAAEEAAARLRDDAVRIARGETR